MVHKSTFKKPPNTDYPLLSNVDVCELGFIVRRLWFFNRILRSIDCWLVVWLVAGSWFCWVSDLVRC